MPLIIKIPTWATLSRFPVGTPEDKLAILSNVLQTDLQVGSFNPVWYDLQDLDLGGGPLTRSSNILGLAQVTPISNTSMITINHAQLAVIIGGDIEGMEVYFELDSLENEVPETFTNRIITNTDLSDPENPVITTSVHTWETWGRNGDSHAPKQIENKWYKSNSDANNSGIPLPASLWVFSGLTIKTVLEYKALLPQPNLL